MLRWFASSFLTKRAKVFVGMAARRAGGWRNLCARSITDLRKFNQRLILRRGAAADVIPALAREANAGHVYWNRRYDLPGIAADDAVITKLKADGVSGGTFPGNLLVEPGRIQTKNGGPLRVFTPFWKRILSMGDLRKPLLCAEILAASSRW